MYETQIESVANALRVLAPDRHHWFGERSPKLRSDIVARVDPEILRQHLIAQVQSRLYRHFYQLGIAVPAVQDAAAVAVSERRDFVHSLSAANQGQGTWQDGWSVVESSETGVRARRDGITVHVPIERRRDNSGPTIAVLMPKEFLKQSPGFYLAQSDVSLQPQTSDILVRLYWHVTASGARSLVESATSRLNAERVPFHLKVLDSPGAYRRNDAAVLYITKRDLRRASPLLDQIYEDVRHQLDPGEPALTKRLAPGLGLAEDPRNGESFGLHRCRLLAKAFVDAAWQGVDDSSRLIQAVVDHFQAERLDVACPYLNPGSSDDYDQFFNLESDSRGFVNRRITLTDRFDLPLSDSGSWERCASYLDIARVIADRLVRDAVWHDGRCTWLGPRQSMMIARAFDRHQATYGVIGPDLYSGTAGIALFLAQIFVDTGDEAYRMAARGAVQQAMRTVEQLAGQGRIGFYTGWPGVAVASARVGRLTGDLDLSTDLSRQLVAHLFDYLQTSEVDLLSGTAGAVSALLALWRLSGDEEYLENATQLGDFLLASAKHRGEATWWPVQTQSGRRPLTGFAHGAAGIAFALLELFDATADQRYRQAAEGAFAFEQRNFHPGLQNWLDLRYPVEGSRFGPGALAASVWCHGSGGIAVSRLTAWKMLGERTYLDEAELALRATCNWLDPERSPSNDRWSLCHGLAGNADILLWASRSAPDRSIFLGRAHAVADKGVALARASDQATDLFATDEPGLFLGHAGIGYFYLRLANPAIPSVLVPSPSALAAFPNS